MNLPQAYFAVSKHSLAVADDLRTDKHYESAAFFAYHSFENAGGALCESRGTKYHPKRHATKINLFKQDAMRSGIGHGVAQASMIFAAVRNLCLYPIESPSGSKSYITPDQLINPQAASDMIRRAKGIAAIIAPLI